MHEGLGVDVLVVLYEVEPTLERLIDDAAIVATGEAQLRFGGGAKKRAAELVEALALDDDAGCRTLERLGVVGGDAHVFQAQRFDRLEPEDIADDRGGEVSDRPGLE